MKKIANINKNLYFIIMEKAIYSHTIEFDKLDFFFDNFLIGNNKIYAISDDELGEYHISNHSIVDGREHIINTNNTENAQKDNTEILRIKKAKLILKSGVKNEWRVYGDGHHFLINDVIYTASRDGTLDIRNKENVLTQYLDLGIVKYTHKIEGDNYNYVTIYDCGSNIVYTNIVDLSYTDNMHYFSTIIPKNTQNITGNIDKYTSNFKIIKGNCIGIIKNKNRNDDDKNDDQEIIYDVTITEKNCNNYYEMRNTEQYNYLIAVDMNNKVTRLYSYEKIYSNCPAYSNKLYADDKIYIMSPSYMNNLSDVTNITVFDFKRNNNSNFDINRYFNLGLYLILDDNHIEKNGFDLLNPSGNKAVEMYQSFEILNKVTVINIKNGGSKILINNSKLYVHKKNSIEVFNIPKNVETLNNLKKSKNNFINIIPTDITNTVKLYLQINNNINKKK